jgi:hypothetical protein
VRLDALPESLSDRQLTRLLSDAPHPDESLIVSLVTPDGGTAYQSVVAAPAIVRAEFHGQSKQDDIDGRTFPTDAATFVVRVPALPGAVLTLRDPAGSEVGRFDLAALAATTPRINLEGMQAHVSDLRVTGSSLNRVDWLIVGDGYTAAQQNKFLDDADNLALRFFGISGYAEYANFVNVRTLFVPSGQAGADHPPYDAACPLSDGARTCCGDPAMLSDPLNGAFVNTAFNGRYCMNNMHRLMAVDASLIYAAAAAAPNYDTIVVIVNDAAYGGAGGAMAITSMHASSVEIAQHEYGHSFAHLADEYESLYPGYPACSDANGAQPCEANVTDITDRGAIKWAPWIGPDVPIPTEPQWDDAFVGVAGLFRGARYQSDGMYRSGQLCLMRSLGAPLCQVPAQAYVLRLYNGGWGTPALGIRLIEPGTTNPTSSLVIMPPQTTQVFHADLLQPIGSPPLRVSWLINDAVVAGANSPSFTYTSAITQVGALQISLRVEDLTPLVHPEMAGNALTSIYTWTVVAPTPTPTPSRTRTPTATRTPTRTRTATPTATPTLTATPTPSVSATGTPTASPTAVTRPVRIALPIISKEW